MKRLIFTILTLSTFTILKSQNSLSFYHLGNETFQNSHLNPAWISNENEWLLGLPVLSGVHVHVNNKLSYNELFTREGNQVTVDIDKALTNLQRQNIASVRSTVSIFHLAKRLKKGSMVSFFINERLEADFLYPRQLVNTVWNGNLSELNQEIRIGRVGFRANHFREIGLGYAYSFNENLNVGLRAKYLAGFLDVSTPGNLRANLTFNGEIFQIDNAELRNARLRTSGLDIYEGDEGDLGSHLVFNGNNGVALDFGFNYRLSKYYSFAGSILDIGFISWNENIVNDVLSDSTFTYDGINLDGIGDVRQTLEDSLFRQFETREDNEAYTTWLPITAYGSWIFHYSERTDLYGTLGTRILHGQVKMLYGGGVTHKFGKVFTGSLSAMKLPQQFVNVGAAFTVNGGPVQFYMAADQIINFSLLDFRAIDYRVGINFRFNSGKGGSEIIRENRGRIGGAKGVDTNFFLGEQVKTKRREGIYSVIKRQRKREVDAGEPQTKKVKQRNVGGGGAAATSADTKRVLGKGSGRRKSTGPSSYKRKVQKKSLNGRGASSTRGTKKRKVQKKSLTGRKF